MCRASWCPMCSNWFVGFYFCKFLRSHSAVIILRIFAEVSIRHFPSSYMDLGFDIFLCRSWLICSGATRWNCTLELSRICWWGQWLVGVHPLGGVLAYWLLPPRDLVIWSFSFYLLHWIFHWWLAVLIGHLQLVWFRFHWWCSGWRSFSCWILCGSGFPRYWHFLLESLQVSSILFSWSFLGCRFSCAW